MSRTDDPTNAAAEPFWGRWSRLKRSEAELETPPTPDAEAAVEPPPAELESETETETDAEVLARLKLPDPDQLGPGDDFSAFMGRAVPSRLRNRALRRLWGLNPTLANLDELVDYGEDFTDAATVIENLTTAYQVGRGYLTPEPEPEDAALDEAATEGEAVAAAEDAPAAEATPASTSADGEAVDASADVSQADQSSDQSAAVDHAVTADRAEPQLDALRPPPRRRVRFRFEEDVSV